MEKFNLTDSGSYCTTKSFERFFSIKWNRVLLFLMLLDS